MNKIFKKKKEMKNLSDCWMESSPWVDKNRPQEVRGLWHLSSPATAAVVVQRRGKIRDRFGKRSRPVLLMTWDVEGGKNGEVGGNWPGLWLKK